jgi:hypothetical protein
LISIVQQRLALWLDTGGVGLSDGTLIGVANYSGCERRSELPGFARFGLLRHSTASSSASGLSC